MRIFPPELQVGDLEGFTSAKDIFGRKPLGDGLTNLLTKVADPTVVAVDAPWGAGKTAFLRMWAGELRKLGVPVVYFDAFKHDYSDDAFTAIAGQVLSLLEVEKKNTPAAQAFLKHAKGAGKILLRSGLRLGVKVATLSTVDTKDFEDQAAAVADELSGLADKYVGELLTEHSAKEKTFEAFGNALAALPSILAPPEDVDGVSVQRPLVFIIDELDRCRPIYALQVLERVKHFLSVPNVHFVFGAHMRQVQNSVVAAYGEGIDARLYLQKFIHVTVHLQDDERHEHERTIPRYVDHLANVLAFDPRDQDAKRNCIKAIKAIAARRELSLRSVERVMTYLALALTFSGKTFLRPPPMIAGLCVLKVLEPELYVKAKKGELRYDEVAGALGLPKGQDNNDFDVRWWRFCTDPYWDNEKVQGMYEVLGQYSLSNERMDILPMLVRGVADRLSAN